MSWVAVGVAVVGGVASYASASSAEDQSEESQKAQAEAQKQLVQLKRQYQLEDRKYNQDAIGAWGKYADPANGAALTGSSAPIASSATSTPNVGSTTGPAGTGTNEALPTTTGDNNEPITDPNNPLFAANPVAAASNALPLNARAGARWGQAPPSSLWYTAPQYVPSKTA